MAFALKYLRWNFTQLLFTLYIEVSKRFLIKTALEITSPLFISYDSISLLSYIANKTLKYTSLLYVIADIYIYIWHRLDWDCLRCFRMLVTSGALSDETSITKEKRRFRSFSRDQPLSNLFIAINPNQANIPQRIFQNRRQIEAARTPSRSQFLVILLFWFSCRLSCRNKVRQNCSLRTTGGSSIFAKRKRQVRKVFLLMQKSAAETIVGVPDSQGNLPIYMLGITNFPAYVHALSAVPSEGDNEQLSCSKKGHTCPSKMACRLIPAGCCKTGYLKV